MWKLLSCPMVHLGVSVGKAVPASPHPVPSCHVQQLESLSCPAQLTEHFVPKPQCTLECKALPDHPWANLDQGGERSKDPNPAALERGCRSAQGPCWHPSRRGMLGDENAGSSLQRNKAAFSLLLLLGSLQEVWGSSNSHAGKKGFGIRL